MSIEVCPSHCSTLFPACPFGLLLAAAQSATCIALHSILYTAGEISPCLPPPRPYSAALSRIKQTIRLARLCLFHRGAFGVLVQPGVPYGDIFGLNGASEQVPVFCRPGVRIAQDNAGPQAFAEQLIKLLLELLLFLGLSSAFPWPVSIFFCCFTHGLRVKQLPEFVEPHECISPSLSSALGAHLLEQPNLPGRQG